jgi:hypothetical protein
VKTYTVDEIKDILILHKKWWNNENGGKRADLQRADLQGAYLRGADLQGADLQGAYLRGADLQGADLQGAYLQGAYLRGADLRGADLRGAKYGDEELLVKYFTIGPIGSRSDYLQIFVTDKRTEIKTGCFTGSLDDFTKQVTTSHGTNDHGKSYLAAIEFIKILTTGAPTCRTY